MEEEEKQEKLKASLKAIITFLSVTIITILIIIIGHSKFNLESKRETKYLKAEISSVFINEIPEEEIDDDNVKKDISFEARLTENKDMPNPTVFGRQVINNLIPRSPVKEGSKVILTKNEGSEIYTFVDYDKTNIIIALIILFAILAVIVGLWKGFKSVVAILLNVMLIFFIYIPAIILGANIYLATILLIIYITLINSILLSGFNKRTRCAIISVVIGTALLAGLTLLVNKIFMITGITTDESAMFNLNNPDLKINLLGITWAAIIIGTLGAVISISTSISTVIKEEADDMSENLEQKSFKVLYKLGIEEGRIKIGQMLNTLVLAFIGSTLSVLILYIANSKDYFFLFNSEQIILFIIQVIISSTGVILIIPITAIISTFTALRKKKEDRKFIQKYSEGLSLNLNKNKAKEKDE